MERRAALEPYIDRHPVFNLDGGKYSKFGCMSLEEYKTNVAVYARQDVSKIK